MKLPDMAFSYHRIVLGSLHLFNLSRFDKSIRQPIHIMSVNTLQEAIGAAMQINPNLPIIILSDERMKKTATATGSGDAHGAGAVIRPPRLIGEERKGRRSRQKNR